MKPEQFKEHKTPTPKSIKELSKFISELIPENKDLSYQDEIQSLVIGLELVFNFMRSKLATTNESFSEAELLFLMRQRKTDAIRVLNYQDLLHPQYCNEECFPTAEYLIRINQDYLKKKALELLEENKDRKDNIHPLVWEHWENLAKENKIEAQKVISKEKALEKIKVEIEKIIGVPLSCTFYQSHLLFKKQEDNYTNQNIMKFLVSFAMKFNYEIYIGKWNDMFNKIYLKIPVDLTTLNSDNKIVINPNVISYDH